MKSFFNGVVILSSLAIGLGLSSLPGLTANASDSVLSAPGKISVGIVSSESKEEFAAKVLPFFTQQWSQCSNCELRNLSTYDDKGLWSEKDLAATLESSSVGISFLFLNFNRRYKPDENKPLVEALKKISAAGVIVVGSAGYTKEGEISAPLARTLLGQVPELIFVGEMNERERMLTSFFGPEMLTVVKPPKDLIGKGLGPAYFVARFASNFSRKMPKDWIAHFRIQKAKSRRIWPTLEDFFPR